MTVVFADGREIQNVRHDDLNKCAAVSGVIYLVDRGEAIGSRFLTLVVRDGFFSPLYEQAPLGFPRS